MITGDYALKKQKKAKLKFKRHMLTHKHHEARESVISTVRASMASEPRHWYFCRRGARIRWRAHSFWDRACTVLGQPFPVARPHVAQPKMRVSVKGWK